MSESLAPPPPGDSRAVIGRNFTLTQGVLLGETESGAPVIGDDVHCGVGCKIIGGILVERIAASTSNE